MEIIIQTKNYKIFYDYFYKKQLTKKSYTDELFFNETFIQMYITITSLETTISVATQIKNFYDRTINYYKK
jgi:hypothetical protein